MHVLKYYFRPLDVPHNTWLIRRCCAFIKPDYFPSAFNKNQRGSLTHRLETAFAGYRGWDFSGGTGRNCSQIGNRRPETKEGRGTGKREAEQEINAELMLSEGFMAGSLGGAPERLLRPRSREQGFLASHQQPLCPLPASPLHHKAAQPSSWQRLRVFGRCPVVLSGRLSPPQGPVITQS